MSDQLNYLQDVQNRLVELSETGVDIDIEDVPDTLEACFQLAYSLTKVGIELRMMVDEIDEHHVLHECTPACRAIVYGNEREEAPSCPEEEFCEYCHNEWPCEDHLIIHPEENE